MPAQRLDMIRIEKPWGRRHLWPGFADPGPQEGPIGEIWFASADGSAPDLLVKYLFTSEKLSIQVHPDDAAAQRAGYPRGKEEAWVILAAEPDSTIAIGTKQPMTQEELRTAALDGSIESRVDWKPAKAGDVIYSPAGTVHAIGAGLTLVEVQQNVDLTYRLYDYGRPRELHLDDGIAVSDPVPFTTPAQQLPSGAADSVLHDSGKFHLACWGAPGARRTGPGASWLVPLTGSGTIDGAAWQAGECWMVEGECAVEIGADSTALYAYAL